jgi:putative thioredoxin
MQSYTYDVTDADFEAGVIARSHEVPVIVDFWAPWCAPCRSLKPVLEKLADEYRGEFILAKVNTDENTAVAARYGIRGIPNVKAFSDGKVVSEFSGALAESAVRAFLQKLLPGPGEKLRAAARRSVSEGDFDSAEARLREAVALEPALPAARLDLVELLTARQAWTEADSVLAELPERERDERADLLASRIALWKSSQQLPPLAELASAVERRPDDLRLRLNLAERQVVEGDFEPALEQLLAVVRGDRGELRENARKRMLDVFALAQDDPELIPRYRRLLASALY